jgi:hypothetical protein
MAYFFTQYSNTTSWAPELLGMLLTQSREVIASIMKNAWSLTVGILKSLYLKANLDEVGEGFVATCSEEEAVDLVQSFIETMTQVIEMILIDMS